MPTIYTIRLNLGGNIVERLTVAERILDRINAKAAKGVRVTGTGVGTTTDTVTSRARKAATIRNPYPYIPPRARMGIDMFYQRASAMGSSLSRDAFNKRFNDAFASIHRFRSDFIKNTFSVSGWGRNLGNFTSSIGAVGKAAAAAAPALASTVGALAAAYAVLKVAPLAIGGIAYTKAKKVLFSEEMTQAIGQRAQFNLARSGLDQNYTQAYSSASSISAQYGFNRAQVLGTINALSGLDGIDTQMAANLSRVSGKVAQFGSRPFDIVALNLQQILGAGGKPNARDIRELLHAAPILNRYAQEDMRQNNITGMESREYLASDQSALLRVLQRFDKEYQPSDIARVRGLVDLEKSDRWINIEEQFQDFFRITGEQVLRVEQSKSRFAELFHQSVDLQSFENITIMWTSFLDGLYSFGAGVIADIINLAAALGEWGDKLGLNLNTGWKIITGDFVGAGKNIWGAITNDEIPRTNYERAKFNQDINRIWVGDIASKVLSNPEYANLSEEEKEKVRERSIIQYAPWAARGWSEGHTAEEYLKWRNHPDRSPEWSGYAGSRGTPGQNSRMEEITQGIEGLANAAAGLDWGNIGKGTAANDTEEIEDLTKGSKALFINFNAPVVQLDNVYNTGADPEEIRTIIGRDIDEGVSRALQLALYNTTRSL